MPKPLWASAPFSVLLTLGFSCSWPASAAEYWVSPDGRDDPKRSGASEQPFATIRFALARATKPGDRVTVRAGTYRNEHAVFRGSGTAENPITLQAEKGAKVVLKGSTEVSPASWKLHQGAIYQAPWNFYFGAWEKRYLDDNPKNDPWHRGNKPRHRFFADGDVLEEVGRMDWLKENSYFINRAEKTVYVWLKGGANPATKTVEGTTQELPLIATWGHSHLVIRGLHLEHLANGSQGNAALRVSAPFGGHKGGQSNDILIEDVAISKVAGSALSVNGSRHIVRRGAFNDNGQNGLHVAIAHDCLFEDIQYLRNNMHPGKEFDVGWEAVMKVASSTNNVFNRLESGHNNGMGFWIDGPNNRGNVLKNSRIHHNKFQGVRLEICYDTTISNNLLYGNRQVAIEISASIANRIFHNTIADNFDAALGIDRVAKWREGWEMSSYGNVILNNIVANNQRDRYKKSWIVAGAAKDTSQNLPQGYGKTPVFPYADNVVNHNLFFLSADHPQRGTETFISGGRFKTFEEYQQKSGLDAASKWGDPMFVDAKNADYRLKAGSAARGMGADATLIAAPVDARGVKRQAGAVDVGAFQYQAGD